MTTDICPLFAANGGTTPRCAVLMSGSGTNAEVLLERAARPDAGFAPVVIVTDAPETSRARELGRRFDLPVAEFDIRKFYREHGEEKITLDSEQRRELRNRWSELLRREMVKFNVNFGILAGFVPLTNLADTLPCLNVHPGDLTLANSDGSKLLAGLHYKPVERAILLGHTTLRSSVILAQPYIGSGKGQVDSGPVLGVSEPLEIDFDGASTAELREIADRRGKPPFNDRLRAIAAANVERLKFAGDHVVFPGTVIDFAAGRFGLDAAGKLHYLDAGKWRRVLTVEYHRDSTKSPVAG